MRLYNYLTEQELSSSNYLQIIEEKCKPFLSDVKKAKRFLLSGKRSSKVVFQREVRKNRKPKDTSKTIHDLANVYFKDKFGVEARNKSIFCTGDLSETGRYGDTYLIFPVGEYEIIWSPKVKDFTVHVTDKKNFKKYSKAYHKIGTEEEREKQLNQFIKDIVDTYKTGDLKKAIKSKNEIMLICEEYIAVHYNKKDEVESYFI